MYKKMSKDESFDDGWEKCIETMDKNLAQQLLEQNVLPNQDSINKACLNFGRKHEIVMSMCKTVCTYIEKNQPQTIQHVWPSYTYVKNESISIDSVNDVTFVIEKKSEENVNMKGINMYKTCVRAPSEISKESMAINQQEATTSHQQRKNMKRKRKEIVKFINDNVDKLLAKHSNITTVSASLYKSRNFGHKNAIFEENLCIALYVHVKGYIPLNEDPFVQKIDKYDVDVRECVFTPLGSGPNEFHPILKTGLEIGITPNLEINGSNNKFGTLGYLDPPTDPTHFVTCAHVVLDNEELKRTHNQDTNINVYQPSGSESREICGRAIKTVYQEEGENGIGVDAALVKIMKRKSNGFSFPQSEITKNRSMITGIYRPNPDRNDVELLKYGCASKLTHGSYPFASHLIVVKESNGLTLRNQIAIIPTSDYETFCVKGDSGAVVFELNAGKLYATCMVEGLLSDGRTVATPLIEVFVALQIKSPSDEQKLYDSEDDESDMDCS